MHSKNQRETAMLPEHNGDLIPLKKSTYTNPALQRSWRRLSEVRRDLFCFHQDRSLTASEDVVMGCAMLYKHGSDIKANRTQGTAIVAFEWRQGLWSFAFIIVTLNSTKEMLLYKHNSLISGCWTFTVHLPKPLMRKTMTWQMQA